MSVHDTHAQDPQEPGSGLFRIRGILVVGKDGYGLTPCGSDRQRKVDFSPAAQAEIAAFLEAGWHSEFYLDGWARARAGRLHILSIERLDADETC